LSINLFINVLLPFFSSIIILLFGRNLGLNGGAFLSIFNIFIIYINIILIIYKSSFIKFFFYLKYLFWINLGLLNVSWGFLFDYLTIYMIFIITSISLMVQFYSFEYMYNDPYILKFFSFLSLFSFCMLIMVSADNLLQLFLGWEGVGICSYLLISFWNTRIMANKSAIKALLVNKIGDIFLIITICIFFYYFKTLDFTVIFILYPFFLIKKFIFININLNLLNSIAFFLLVGAMAKSSQIGLHTWLPDAMEGPTPVSALLHAATMVTAGVFLIIRFSPIFEYSSSILIKMSFIGSLTAFLGASIGMVQNDIKKIIAYSTCSQLGYMILSCSLSNYSGSLYHLLNHAFFKALLFLSAGSIIHSLSDEQDIRKMGNLVNIIPFIYVCFLIGSLALAGFPFLPGFYSKDYILESSLVGFSFNSSISFSLGTISAFLTSFYSFRLINLVFFNYNHSYKKVIFNFENSTIFIYISLLFLVLNSIISGYFFKERFIGSGSNFLGTSIFILPWNNNIVDIEYIPFTIKIMPIFFSIIAIFIVIYCYNYLFFILIFFKLKFYSYYQFFNNKWYFNTFYNFLIIKPFFKLSYNFFFLVTDRGFCDLTGITNLLVNLSWSIFKLYNGNTRNYVIIFLSNFLIYLYLLYYIIN